MGKNKVGKWLTSIVIVIVAVWVTACAQGTQKTPTPAAAEKETQAPVELLVFKWGGVTLTATEVEKYFNEPIAKKFPHIKVKLIDVPEGDPIEPLLTQGIIPDIIFGGSYTAIEEAGLAEELAPYKEKFGYFDKRVKQSVNESIELKSGGNQVPFSVNLPVIYYNKDIFDKFSVPYPTEVQSWDQILDTAKQLTRADAGVNYVGIDLQPTRLASGLSLDIIDPATNRAAVTSPEWVKVFETLKKLYSIPGFIGTDDKYKYTDKDDIFYNDQNLALYSHNLAQLIGPLEELRKQGITMNWDFAPHPNFEEALGTSIEINVHTLTLSKASKHKDEAYQVIQYMLSEEVQRTITRNGRVSVLDLPELEKEYGADIEVLKGKTIENIFKTEPRKIHKPNIYESKITKYINDAAKDVAIGGVDINTALRTAKEKIDKDLETLEATKS